MHMLSIVVSSDPQCECAAVPCPSWPLSLANSDLSLSELGQPGGFSHSFCFPDSHMAQLPREPGVVSHVLAAMPSCQLPQRLARRPQERQRGRLPFGTNW